MKGRGMGMDALERDVAESIAERPLRHAALVHDLVYDRAAAPSRSIDPLIVARHRDNVVSDILDVAGRRMAEAEGNPILMRMMAQTAVSHAVERTHRAMMDLGHLTSAEERGALAGGRMLFAATIAEDVATVMARR